MNGSQASKRSREDERKQERIWKLRRPHRERKTEEGGKE